MATNAVDRGMGFGLPAHDEIARLCASTVEALTKLPLEAESADFQMGLADIFGASARIAMRKKGARRAPPAARLAQDYPMLDDVVYAFPARIARLLDPRNMLLPDIQSSAIAALNDVFPPADWTLATSADGLRSFVPVTREPSCVIPVPGPGPLLLLVRLYVAVEGRPFRVMLCSDDDELAGFDAYRADSLLLTPIVHCPPGASRLRVSIRTKGLGAALPLDFTPVFTVAYLGAFAL